MKDIAIEIFLASYENMSISKAAKELYFSKQSVSHIIKTLETELGVELFQGDRSGLHPTKAADELYSIFKSFKMDIRKIEEFYKIKKNPYSVTIADNNFETISSYFTASLEKYYHESVLYSYVNEDSQEVYNMLLNKQCDIGIFAIPKTLEASVRESFKFKNIQLQLLLTTEPCVIVNKNHPLAKLDIITSKDLKGFKRIDLIRSKEREWYFNNYFKDNHINLNAEINSNSISNIIASLKLLDYYFISVYSPKDNPYIYDLKMIPFKGTSIEILMFLGYNTEASFDKVAEHFIKLVRKHYTGDENEN